PNDLRATTRTLPCLFWQGSHTVLGNRCGIGPHAHLALVHTSIEHRRVSCRGVLISGCVKPYAQRASYPVEWCSRLLKMTFDWFGNCPEYERLLDGVKP